MSHESTSAEPRTLSAEFAAILEAWTAKESSEPTNRPEIKRDTASILRQQRLDRFRELCPAEFRAAIDRAKVPNLAAWDDADRWDGTHPGIWLWSHETGRAKSRMLWRQFGRLHVEHGKRILRITGQQLAEEYFAQHMAGEPREFYKWVSRHQVLMLDDLDKIDTAEMRTAKMLRELWDVIYAEHIAVLVTANEPPAHFEQKLGRSLGRRIAESVREIKF